MKYLIIRYFYSWFCLYRRIYKVMFIIRIPLKNLINVITDIPLIKKSFIRNSKTQHDDIAIDEIFLKDYWCAIDGGEAVISANNTIYWVAAVFILTVVLTFTHFNILVVPSSFYPFVLPVLLLSSFFLPLVLLRQVINKENVYVPYFKMFEQQSKTYRLYWHLLNLLLTMMLLVYFCLLII